MRAKYRSFLSRWHGQGYYSKDLRATSTISTLMTESNRGESRKRRRKSVWEGILRNSDSCRRGGAYELRCHLCLLYFCCKGDGGNEFSEILNVPVLLIRPTWISRFFHSSEGWTVLKSLEKPKSTILTVLPALTPTLTPFYCQKQFSARKERTRFAQYEFITLPRPQKYPRPPLRDQLLRPD